jgi:hypothetical protein
LVAQLERNGLSLDQAKILLKEFELIQATGIEHLARLRKVAEQDNPWRANSAGTSARSGDLP